ncbi:MAG: aminopeptidase [Deltaproteobacteria bacterium]|nr:aminopeptidase [Deltaproteobacteria bacterium]
MLNKAIRELYITNLAVRKNEKALVFTDTLLPDEDITEEDSKRRKALVGLARQVADAGSEVCRNITFLAYPSSRSHGSEPPRDIWQKAFGDKTVKELEDYGFLGKLLNKEQLNHEEIKDIKNIIETNKADALDVVIALSNFSTSHTKFRDLLTNICKTRYASMPLFDETMFYGAMQVDWNALEKRTNNLAACMNGAEKVLVTTPNGTDMVIGIKGRKILADTGNLTEPGSFGNLPAGEVFVAPVEGTTEGVLVLEWAPTFKLESPVTVKIEKGLVKDISGKDPYAKKLESKLNENPDFRNIAELGIGTNDMAKRADNILESEKILGTIHIAFGDNSTFGGNVRTPFHQDFVVLRPTVTIVKENEEKAILYDGVLSI